MHRVYLTSAKSTLVLLCPKHEGGKSCGCLSRQYGGKEK
nr:MAG TPA: hypothetical protein [Caudoviricetes sp.]DAY88168.1 MAG TPA: hypothetical protein [Caudoviricetes sp.]